MGEKMKSAFTLLIISIVMALPIRSFAHPRSPAQNIKQGIYENTDQTCGRLVIPFGDDFVAQFVYNPAGPVDAKNCDSPDTLKKWYYRYDPTTGNYRADPPDKPYYCVVQIGINDHLHEACFFKSTGKFSHFINHFLRQGV